MHNDDREMLKICDGCEVSNLFYEAISEYKSKSSVRDAELLLDFVSSQLLSLALAVLLPHLTNPNSSWHNAEMTRAGVTMT